MSCPACVGVIEAGADAGAEVVAAVVGDGAVGVGAAVLAGDGVVVAAVVATAPSVLAVVVSSSPPHAASDTSAIPRAAAERVIERVLIMFVFTYESCSKFVHVSTVQRNIFPMPLWRRPSSANT
jgi:hypothetical protein